MNLSFEVVDTTKNEPLLSGESILAHSFDNGTSKRKENKGFGQNRPISFTSNMFTVSEMDSDRKFTRTIKKQEVTLNTTITNVSHQSLFATFAITEEVQEVPYFQEIQRNQTQPYLGLGEEMARNESYKSNFIAEQEPRFSPKKQQKPVDPRPKELEIVAEVQEKEVEKGKVMEAQGLMEVSKGKHQAVTFKISERKLAIQGVPLELRLIGKLKIFAAEEAMPKHQFIKTSIKGMGEELLIGLKKGSRYGDYPLPYFTFAKIAIKKLKHLGVSSITTWTVPEKPPATFRIMKPFPKSKVPKGKSEDKSQSQSRSKSKEKPKKPVKQQEEESSEEEEKMVACRAVTYIHGNIYKKSKHLGHWQNRYIIVNQLGIYSYRNQEDEKASVQIQRSNIKYIWTNFGLLMEEEFTPTGRAAQQETIYRPVEYQERQLGVKQNPNRDRNYLIVKVKHGFSEQTQFAIPISNFDTESIKKNWLFGFYRVLPNFVPT